MLKNGIQILVIQRYIQNKIDIYHKIEGNQPEAIRVRKLYKNEWRGH